MPSPDIPSERVSSGERGEERGRSHFPFPSPQGYPSSPPSPDPYIPGRLTCLVVTRKLPPFQVEGPPV